MRELWMYAAILNIALIPVVIWFALRINHGAGFKCKIAFTRLIHRIVLCLLALSMLACALSIGHEGGAPSPVCALFFQFCFIAAMLVSFYRHWSAPVDIPANTGWGKQIDTVFRVR